MEIFVFFLLGLDPVRWYRGAEDGLHPHGEENLRRDAAGRVERSQQVLLHFPNTKEKIFLFLISNTSAYRYYLNNFVDGDRTDAMRFFVGEVTPEDYFR